MPGFEGRLRVDGIDRISLLRASAPCDGSAGGMVSGGEVIRPPRNTD